MPGQRSFHSRRERGRTIWELEGGQRAFSQWLCSRVRGTYVSMRSAASPRRTGTREVRHERQKRGNTYEARTPNFNAERRFIRATSRRVLLFRLIGNIGLPRNSIRPGFNGGQEASGAGKRGEGTASSRGDATLQFIPVLD